MTALIRFLVLAVALLTACSSSDSPGGDAVSESSLVGTWYCRSGGSFPFVLSLRSNGSYVITPAVGGGLLQSERTSGNWDLGSGMVMLVQGGSVVGEYRATRSSIDIGGGCSRDRSNLLY